MKINKSCIEILSGSSREMDKTYDFGAVVGLSDLSEGSLDKSLSRHVVEPAAEVCSKILSGLDLAGENGVGLQGSPDGHIGNRGLVADEVAAKGQVVVQLLEDHIQGLEVRAVDNILALVNKVVHLESKRGV